MDNNGGRPAYTDDQYQTWLDDLKPWLKQGNTLSYAIDKAGLETHRTTLYEKYRLNDWFSDKINRMRAIPGELVNEFFVKEVERIMEKQKKEIPLTKEEIDTMKHFSEKHRSAQPFFVSRVETAQVDPNKVGAILDQLEDKPAPKTDYGQLGQAATGQMVANNPPVQNPK